MGEYYNNYNDSAHLSEKVDYVKPEVFLLYSRMHRLQLLSDSLHMYSAHCRDILSSIMSKQHIPEELLLQYLIDIDNIFKELNSVHKSVGNTIKALQEPKESYEPRGILQ